MGTNGTTVATNTAFVDLSTFTTLESYIYGGPAAISWFLASFQKSNWFSFIPVQVRHTGTVDFGQTNTYAAFNRSGDYILNVWFRALLPMIMLTPTPSPTTVGPQPLNPGATLRWTNFPMHNLFERIHLTFNDLVVQQFSSHWLDNRFQFNTDASKRLGYRNMIGDIDAFTGPKNQGVPVGTGSYLNLPIPLFFAEDSGVALPVSALPYNEIKIVYNLRPFNQLVVIEPGVSVTLPGPITTRPPTTADIVLVGAATTIIDMDGNAITTFAPGTGPITLLSAQTYVHFAVVHDDERAKMGSCPRDLLIHQIQEAQLSPFRDLGVRASFDIRFSHAIIALFFSARNDTIFHLNGGAFGRDWSNYTTSVDKSIGFDPLEWVTLLYDSTPRFSMGADYFSLVSPWYWARSIPEDTGYHMYSYALHPFDMLTPSGSTNYSKLANVTIFYDLSPAAQLAAGAITVPPSLAGTPISPDGTTVLTYGDFPAVYRATHILIALSYNLIRLVGGSLGFPSL